jgi:hypothetical protein
MNSPSATRAGNSRDTGANRSGYGVVATSHAAARHAVVGRSSTRSGVATLPSHDASANSAANSSG